MFKILKFRNNISTYTFKPCQFMRLFPKAESEYFGVKKQTTNQYQHKNLQNQSNKMNTQNGEQRNDQAPINIQGLQGGENVQQPYSTSGEDMRDQFQTSQHMPPKRGNARGTRGIKRGVNSGRGQRAAPITPDQEQIIQSRGQNYDSYQYYDHQHAEPQFYPTAQQQEEEYHYYNDRPQQFYEQQYPAYGQPFRGTQYGGHAQRGGYYAPSNNRSRGKPSYRGRGMGQNAGFYEGQQGFIQEQYRPVMYSQQQQPSYIVHKRQFSNVNKGGEEPPATPVTKESRVPRKGQGRGKRNEMQETINEKTLPEEQFEFDPAENTRPQPPQQHKIMKKSHGRGQRTVRVAGTTGGIDSFDSEENTQPPRPSKIQYYPQGQHNERPYGEEEEINESLHYQPEYEAYGDYSAQYPKRPVNGTKYRLKTFDDDIESDNSIEGNGSGENVRRGPKLIKFKQKNPSERLALSQLKSEQSQNEILDVYTPQNTQTKTNKIQILKPYRGFEQPEFYQGPQWKFIRQSTNQNSKQKHYENGEYDKVQYNFPGAENELDNKETNGEPKLFPPIQDYSDEDVGIAPSSSNMRAKVTFNKSTKSLSETEQQILAAKQGGNINILQNAFEQQKVAKTKKPAVSNKAFSFDEKKIHQTGQPSQESLLIQGLTKDLKKPSQPVTMEFAEKFFVQEQDQLIKERKNNKQFFEKYINDQTIIEQQIKSGTLWKGVVRMNPKFRHRAYVSIPELNIDVLVESYRMMNRALDGDTVLIELLPVHSWIEMSDQSSLQAKVTTLCNKTGEVQHGMSHLKQADNQAYTNENAIETRMVDKNSLDQLSMSQSQSEEDTTIQPLAKVKPKKFNLNEEDVAGYNASNSDNQNIGKKNRSGNINNSRKCSDVTTSEVQNSTTARNDKMSQNSSEEEGFEIIVEKGQESSIKHQKILSDDDKDLWENLENVGIKGNKVLQQIDSDTPAEKKNVMTIAEFLGQETIVKTSSYNRIELHGAKDQRITQINEHGRTLRPLAKVVGLTNSPNRECNQMVTLVEIEQDSSSQLYQPIKTKSQRDKIQNSLIFAVPVNEKLPWFILNEAPKEFIKDQNTDRNPSHRYYVIKYQDWQTTQKRPHSTMIECIGEAGNLQAESLRLLKMHDICTEQYEVEGSDQTIVHECLKVFSQNIDPKTNEWKIPKDEIAQREDLREKRIFTIDPITARDLDDALSIEKISDKIYEIGVHIADVSYFVQQGSDLDKEALKRSTSTYFVHKVYPMLPRLLCERLCSLNPNVDRLTYSIFFRMNIATGEVDKTFKPEIKRTVIRSCAKWNYELAQKVIKGKVTSEDQIQEELRPQGHSFLDMAQDLLIMNAIAQKRRKERLAAGSLVFNNREFNFTLNQETLYPIKYSESPRMESKQLVEEYMLLANILVAETLFDHCQDRALLRSHADIVENKKNELGNFFKKIGLDQINFTDALSLSQSIAQLELEPDSEDKITVVNRKFITNLTQAKYVTVQNKDPEDFSHYGLNFSLYTHFTSPIRRYADLLVHRLLTICLKEKENTRDKIDGLDYSEYAEIISDQSYNSRKASKECQTLFHCFLLKEQGPRVYDCLIFDVESSHLNVYIQELNINLNVKLREDDRIDQTTFFEDEIKVACTFKTPLMLVKGLREYQGDLELKKSKQQLKKEEEIRRMTQDNEDLLRRLNKTDDIKYRVKEIPSDEQLSTSCIFSVFDRVKIKVEATDTFPMEISSTMLITQEDMITYQELISKQEIKIKEMEQMTKTMGSDGTISQVQMNEEI